jgi:hypothetical protein
MSSKRPRGEGREEQPSAKTSHVEKDPSPQDEWWELVQGEVPDALLPSVNLAEVLVTLRTAATAAGVPARGGFRSTRRVGLTVAGGGGTAVLELLRKSDSVLVDLHVSTLRHPSGEVLGRQNHMVRKARVALLQADRRRVVTDVWTKRGGGRHGQLPE